jgi:vancomycin permeability regulator SanA
MKGNDMLLVTICLIVLLVFLLLFFIWIHTASLQYKGEEAIVILGYKCDGNEIHPFLLERLKMALKLIGSHPFCKIIVLGGAVGSSSKTESEIMRDYLVRNGIQYDRIVMDTESMNTVENLINCKEILEFEKIQACLMISNSFHIRRIHFIAKTVGLKTSFYANRSFRSLISQGIRTLHEIKAFNTTYWYLRKKYSIFLWKRFKV